MILHVAKSKNHRTTQNLRAGFKTNSSKPNSVPCGRFPNPFPQAPCKPTGFSAEFNLTSISLVPLMNPSHHAPQAHRDKPRSQNPLVDKNEFSVEFPAPFHWEVTLCVHWWPRGTQRRWVLRQPWNTLLCRSCGTHQAGFLTTDFRESQSRALAWFHIDTLSSRKTWLGLSSYFTMKQFIIMSEIYCKIPHQFGGTCVG